MAISLSLSFVCIPVCAADNNGMTSAVITDERAQRQAVRAAAAAIICESQSDSITVSNNFVNDILDNVGENPTPENISDGYEAVREFEDSHEREILIHFPTYSSVERLEIGLDCGASLAPADGYSLAVPVVYYGSSITQGGCCSRPGNAYENTISRVLDCDHVNLGFSGSARGEQVIADYTASLEMSTFVLDYDHNAPTLEHLEATHHNFYKTVRAAHPCIPMIFVSRPQAYPTDDDLRRRDIVRQSYEKALAEGDTTVSFIDGIEMMQGEGAEGLVDACHPTDLGFAVMARRIGDELRRVLG